MRWKAFYARFNSKRVAAMAGLAAAASCIVGSCSMPELTRVSDEHVPNPASCSHCHVEIYKEWSQSPHARAFANPAFRLATDGYQQEQCLGCHAPISALKTTEPEARTADREAGITCIACHLDHGAMVGPLPPSGPARPHPIRVEPTLFAGGRLCGQCHKATFEEWLAADGRERRECRDCHMPPVERKITQATSPISKLFVAAEKKAIQHRHVFNLLPANLEQAACTLNVTRSDHELSVVLANRLPHNLPTVDFGVRVVEVVVDGIGQEGVPANLARWELTTVGKGSLPPGQSHQWTTTLPPGIQHIRVRVQRRGHGEVAVITLAEQEIELR